MFAFHGFFPAFSAHPARDDVVEEDELEREHDQQRDRRELAESCIRARKLREVLEVVDAAVLAAASQHEERDEDAVERDDRPQK